MAYDHHEYIGDGVYVSHDGYQAWLSVNAHTAPPVVALDRDVMLQLIKWYAGIDEIFERKLLAYTAAK